MLHGMEASGMFSEVPEIRASVMTCGIGHLSSIFLSGKFVDTILCEFWKGGLLNLPFM